MMAGSTCSWPTGTSMTGPGPTAPWPRRRSSSGAGIGGRFRGRCPVGRPHPYFARRVVGRGVAAGDLDNDGRVDLVVIHRDGPAALLWNRRQAGHWLGIRLQGTRSGRTPVGTRSRVGSDGRSLVRWRTSGTGYLSAHDPRPWFGLGDATKVDRLEIKLAFRPDPVLDRSGRRSHRGDRGGRAVGTPRESGRQAPAAPPGSGRRELRCECRERAITPAPGPRSVGN